MRNYKIEKSLFGTTNWPSVPMIQAYGIPTANRTSPANTQEENENIIQSWNNVIVLRATSDKSTEFHFGYYNKDAIGYLKHDFKTNLDFAVRLGPDDVNFFILPKNLTTDIKLEIVEITTVDNPKYPDLILI